MIKLTSVMERYSSYKDSGVQWLGEIPSHWEVRRLNTFGLFAKGGGISRDNLQDDGKPAILYGDIYTKYNIYADNIINHISESIAEKSIRVFPGDILMTGSGETKEDIGKTIVFRGEEAYIGGDVILFRQVKNNSAFLSYALNSQFAKDYRYRESKGEIIVHIYANNLKRLYLPIPPLSEQQAIASYLDEATSKIDTAISQQQKMIDLLNERKQIIINNAVTKGLNPNVKMKDSGVDWIGEIPEEWEVKKLKHVTSKIGSGSTPRGGAEVYSDFGVRFLRSQNVYNDGLKLADVAYITDNIHAKMKGTQVKYNDILYNITGGSIGRCCCYTEDIDANVNQHVSIVRPLGIMPKFLMFCLQSSNAQRQLRITLKGGNREGLAAETFKEFLIIVPPFNEQQKIVEDIKDKFVTLNQTIESAEKQISLLQERKQIIINEVVTGKVKVS